nr:MAG TPA: hypothetical protein [Caudoviricetes sp.]
MCCFLCQRTNVLLFLLRSRSRLKRIKKLRPRQKENANRASWKPLRRCEAVFLCIF